MVMLYSQYAGDVLLFKEQNIPQDWSPGRAAMLHQMVCLFAHKTHQSVLFTFSCTSISSLAWKAEKSIGLEDFTVLRRYRSCSLSINVTGRIYVF